MGAKSTSPLLSSRSPSPGERPRSPSPSSTLSRMKYVHRSLSLPPVLSVSPSRIELRVDDHWEVILPSRRRDESKLLPLPMPCRPPSLSRCNIESTKDERANEGGDGRRHYVGLGHHYYGRAAQRERALSRRRSWRWDLEKKGRAGAGGGSAEVGFSQEGHLT